MLTVLPMGWSWSFWIIQALHAQFLAEAHFPADRIVTNAWPPPKLSTVPIALPYCDNLTILGLDSGAVDAELENLMCVFRDRGFELHEIEYASTLRDVLGFQVRGEVPEVRPVPAKLWRLVAAMRYASSRPTRSGRQVEKLLGHYTYMALSARPLLGVFRAAYSFIRDSYEIAQAPWDSVRRELLIAAALLPLARSRLDRGWSELAVASDASSSGWGWCTAPVSAELASGEGAWQDRWRYRRLPPSEWAPRRRSAQRFQRPCVLTDPLSVCVFEPPSESLCPRPSELDWQERVGFPEVGGWVEASSWDIRRAGRFKFEEPIGQKEFRTAVWAFEERLRDKECHGKRHLFLIDNLSVCLTIAKGRSVAFGALQLCRRYCALVLSCDAQICCRWIASERTPAVEPSRYAYPYVVRPPLYVSPSGVGQAAGGRRQAAALATSRRRRHRTGGQRRWSCWPAAPCAPARRPLCLVVRAGPPAVRFL